MGFLADDIGIKRTNSRKSVKKSLAGKSRSLGIGKEEAFALDAKDHSWGL